MRSATFMFVVFFLCAPSAHAQTFRSPVECRDCIGNWYYFDQDSSGAVSDWSCGSSSYNGHRGTDFSINGSNGAIDTGYDVVAAADGVVVSAQDGHYDRCTTCDSSVDSRCGLGFGGGFGNHIVVNHGPYRVIYAHLRTGSVRVSVGDTVSCGDAIGQVGSSGCTTGAHLHFEVRTGTASNTAFDPFEGACSPGPSRWTAQGAHRALPGAECDGTPVCPAGTYAIWTCNAESTQRRRCIEGVDMVEPCAYGCQSMPVGTDDTCAPAPDGDNDGSPADEDCDDADPGRRPGLMEVCGDGIDQDCDGADAACPGADTGPVLDSGVVLDASGRDAMTPDSGSSGTLTSGCSCRIGSTPTEEHGRAWWLVGFFALIIRRRAR